MRFSVVLEEVADIDEQARLLLPRVIINRGSYRSEYGAVVPTGTHTVDGFGAEQMFQPVMVEQDTRSAYYIVVCGHVPGSLQLGRHQFVLRYLHIVHSCHGQLLRAVMSEP